MTNRRAAQRIGIALIAVYALILQSLVGNFAWASRATDWPFEVAGRIICVDHGIAPLPKGNLPSDAGNTADCCLPGCSMFPSGLALPPQFGAVFASLQQSRFVSPPISAPIIPLIRAGRPGNPRAPPMKA